VLLFEFFLFFFSKEKDYDEALNPGKKSNRLVVVFIIIFFFSRKL
jgi:hypothetical protein